MRLWFRVVAPHRGDLVNLPRRSGLAILRRYWTGLLSEGWEQLCRARVPRLSPDSAVGAAWGVTRRWWRGNAPEWDLVAESLEDRSLLFGEAKWSDQPFGSMALRKLAAEVAKRPGPELPARYARHRIVRALFVPQVVQDDQEIDGVRIVHA